MGLPGQEFLKKWKDYMREINSGQYLEQHVLDSRNLDPIQTKIRLDVDSRKCVGYLQELISMTNELRIENSLEAL